MCQFCFGLYQKEPLPVSTGGPRWILIPIYNLPPSPWCSSIQRFPSTGHARWAVPHTDIMTQCPESLHRGEPLFSTVHYPQFKHHIYTLLLENTTALLVLCQGNPTRKIWCLCDISQNNLMNKLSSFGWLETLWCSWDAAERLCRFCHFFHPEHDDVIKWKHFPRYWPFVWGIHQSPVNSQTQRPVTPSFDVSFDLHLNKRLSKQSWGWWFETPSVPLWRHCNDNVYVKLREHGLPNVVKSSRQQAASAKYDKDLFLNCTIGDMHQWNINQARYFLQENPFENVVCKMLATLRQSQDA